MKIRNLLMTVAFLLAVTSAFAIKARGKNYDYVAYIFQGKCYLGPGPTNPVDCDQSYTGAQCTYLGLPAWDYDITGFPPPTCTIPLRRL
ncbi:hypothetical protein DBR11_21440 [Pedobacter sp. HMWF019]|uniref:hypothetical protein n=1 Tax=Pedobacter sp. HMWF019 TaxID=2056856 RepID=UPI000D3C37AB|nr:hypothetical protein [Pedobacter sp. HMWF019]PTS95406.1 hypothetical protein DBR11_21440 [Pedobacter sp. HMWF019]